MINDDVIATIANTAHKVYLNKPYSTNVEKIKKAEEDWIGELKPRTHRYSVKSCPYFHWIFKLCDCCGFIGVPPFEINIDGFYKKGIFYCHCKFIYWRDGDISPGLCDECECYLEQLTHKKPSWFKRLFRWLP